LCGRGPSCLQSWFLYHGHGHLGIGRLHNGFINLGHYLSHSCLACRTLWILGHGVRRSTSQLRWSQLGVGRRWWQWPTRWQKNSLIRKYKRKTRTE
jgi:hypothetical protein